MPAIDRRSWRSRYISYLNPKLRFLKPRRPKKVKIKRVRALPFSGVFANSLEAIRRTITDIRTGDTQVLDNRVFLAEDASGYGFGHAYGYKGWTGTVTPDYWELKRKKKKLPVNNYHSEQRSSIATPLVASELYWPFLYEYAYSAATFADSLWPISFGNRVTDEAAFLARTRLHRKINDKSFNAGVCFAERKQTAELIGSTVQRISRAALALRKGNLTKMYAELGMSSRRAPTKAELKRVLNTPVEKRLSQHWLEYTFGWTPLLSDVENAAKLLARHVVGDIFHEEVTVSAKSQAAWKTVQTNVNVQADNVKRWSHDQQCRFKYAARYRLDSYARAALSSTGITNPATVLWEILPYSFVFDWLIPVNTYLEGLMAFDGFELTTLYSIERFHGKTFKDCNRDEWNARGHSVASGGSTFNQNIYHRQILSEWPPNVLPSFRNPLDKGPLWKVVTSMALLSQLFSKSVPPRGYSL